VDTISKIIMPGTTPAPNLVVEREVAGSLLLRLSGDWRQQGRLPDLDLLRQAFLQNPSVQSLGFDTSGLDGWGSRLVAFIRKCAELCSERQIDFRDEGLPQGVRRLLQLAEAAPANQDAHRGSTHHPFLQKLGEHLIQGWQGLSEMMAFLGQNVLAMGKLLRGSAQFRWADALLVMQQSGPQALGIVAMINFLVGLILAFVGAVQLTRFGASIYVADLVAIASVREMGCIMTGIIMCGRTGAAFAAQLGTMKVNQEINALLTFGISPIEFLVLPRMVALLLMMPVLCVFADLISIAGGFCVSVGMLDISPAVYIERTINAIRMDSFFLGILKSVFFGFLVAFTGCLRGMQCGNDAAAVGQATTRAVVTGITAIIASDGVFAVICNALNI
jgi:phospholipid/cholesterol/gamma-HCH transport system permease protein